MIPDNSKLTAEDSRQYIIMLQEIITRMASNSFNCKTWTITIVTAMITLMATNSDLRMFMPVALLPILVFYYLDSYYLGLEKDFRGLQASYVSELRSTNNDCTGSIYVFSSIADEDHRVNFKKALKSKATWPVYLMIALVVTICAIGVYFIKDKDSQNLEKPLTEISSKQDSIVVSIKRLTDKYTPTPPVEIATKVFNNSSFFQANNIDSVDVKVYNNK